MGRLIEILLVTILGMIFGFLIYSMSFKSKPPQQPIETNTYFMCGKFFSYFEKDDKLYLSFYGFENLDYDEFRQVQGLYLSEIINANEVIVYVKPPFNQTLKLAELFNYF